MTNLEFMDKELVDIYDRIERYKAATPFFMELDVNGIEIYPQLYMASVTFTTLPEKLSEILVRHSEGKIEKKFSDLYGEVIYKITIKGGYPVSVWIGQNLCKIRVEEVEVPATKKKLYIPEGECDPLMIGEVENAE